MCYNHYPPLSPQHQHHHVLLYNSHGIITTSHLFRQVSEMSHGKMSLITYRNRRMHKRPYITSAIGATPSQFINRDVQISTLTINYSGKKDMLINMQHWHISCNERPMNVVYNKAIQKQNNAEYWLLQTILWPWWRNWEWNSSRREPTDTASQSDIRHTK